MNVTSVPAPRRLLEPVSPFVDAPSDPPPAVVRSREAPLVLDILRDPRRVVAFMSDADDTRRLVLTALAELAACAIVFAVVVVRDDGLTTVKSGVLLALNLLLALAASIGPIYAAGIVFAARIPAARLVVALLSSMAAGAMVLIAASPVPWVLLGMDRVWRGPLAVVAAFVVAGLAAGSRLEKTLTLIATDAKGTALEEDEKKRVQQLARVASIVVAANVALALWGFDVLA